MASSRLIAEGAFLRSRKRVGKAFLFFFTLNVSSCVHLLRKVDLFPPLSCSVSAEQRNEKGDSGVLWPPFMEEEESSFFLLESNIVLSSGAGIRGINRGVRFATCPFPFSHAAPPGPEWYTSVFRAGGNPRPFPPLRR